MHVLGSLPLRVDSATAMRECHPQRWMHLQLLRIDGQCPIMNMLHVPHLGLFSKVICHHGALYVCFFLLFYKWRECVVTRDGCLVFLQ